MRIHLLKREKSKPSTNPHKSTRIKKTMAHVKRKCKARRETESPRWGLGVLGVPIFYKHVAPLVLKKIIRKASKRFFLTHYVLRIIYCVLCGSALNLTDFRSFYPSDSLDIST